MSQPPTHADVTVIQHKAQEKTELIEATPTSHRIQQAGDITQLANDVPQLINKTETKAITTPTTDLNFRGARSLCVGDTIKQRFILERLLGEGGMGTVFRALDLRKQEALDTKPHVAIKVLSGDFTYHPKALITLQREARKTQELAHPNIVTVYDFDREGDLIYLTMEELQGQSLDKVISQQRQVLTSKKCWDIILQLAQGLAYAHKKGLVHSDLKPANIFLTDNGVVKILDFGIARAANQEAYEDHFDAGDLGAVTFAYASLEMLERGSPHPSDDIYALGIIACELLGGSHPYQWQNAQEVKANHLPLELPKLQNPLLQRLLKNSLHLERSERIQDASDFLKRYRFAKRGVKTLIGSISLLTLALAGNLIYWNYFGAQEIDFEDLPPAQQQAFHAFITETRTALSFDDLQGAVVNLDKAYAIHHNQKDLLQLKKKITQQLQENLTTASTPEQKEFYQQQILQLKSYPAFADKTAP